MTGTARAIRGDLDRRCVPMATNSGERPGLDSKTNVVSFLAVVRGSGWIQRMYSEIASRGIEYDQELFDLCPFKKGYCMKFFRILSTKNVLLVKKLYGLERVEKVNEEALGAFIENTLRRGLRIYNSNSSEYSNTNKSYWTRQAMFLEFVDSDPSMASTLREVLEEIGRSPADLDTRNDSECSVLYVSARAASSFLEYVATRRNRVNFIYFHGGFPTYLFGCRTTLGRRTTMTSSSTGTNLRKFRLRADESDEGQKPRRNT